MLNFQWSWADVTFCQRNPVFKLYSESNMQKALPSKMEAIKVMKPPRNAKQVWTFLGLVGYYCNLSKFCLNGKVINYPYMTQCEIQLDTNVPSSIQDSKRSTDKGTNTILPISLEAQYNVHRCFRWHLQSSNVPWMWWTGIHSQKLNGNGAPSNRKLMGYTMPYTSRTITSKAQISW